MTTIEFPTVQLSDPSYERSGIRHATVFSPALGRRADCSFWGPADGGPVTLIVLLHGVYGSHWAWTSGGGAHLVAKSLLIAGDVTPFALAMPSDGLYGHGSGYVTRQSGDVERWILEEVPALAELAVPGVDRSAPIGIVGLSMGGFGALTLGAWHPDRVAAVVGMSSITDFEQMSYFVGPLDGYVIDADRRSVARSMMTNRNRLPRIMFDCGTDDPLIEPNRELHRELEAAGIEHEWSEHPGDHEWAYWHARLGEAIRFSCG